MQNNFQKNLDNVIFFSIFVGKNPKLNLKKMSLLRHKRSIAGLVAQVPVMLYAQGTGIEHVFDIDRIIPYIAAALLIGFFLLLFNNFVYRFREQDSKIKNQQQNNRLSLVLKTGNLHLWIYDLHTRHYKTFKENGDLDMEHNSVVFSRIFNKKDFDHLRQLIYDIAEERSATGTVDLRSIPDEEGNVKYFEITVTEATRDNYGKLETLLCIQHDVTEDRKRQESVNQTLIRYHTVFNSSLIDMLYYNKDGVLKDLNEKACHTFHVPFRDMVLQDNFLLVNNPMYAGIDFNIMENTRTTSIVNFNNYQEEKYQLEEFDLKNMMYYESTINPIRNEKGELEGIYMAGRNVTEWVESYHRLKQKQKQLRDATKSIRQYIENINYALRIGDVRLANYNPSTHNLELSSNINETQLHLSQLRCIRLGTPRFRRAISSALNRMDHLTELPIELTLEVDLHDEKRRPVWLQFNMVPMKDKEGKVERYFGLCRNMTEMMETEHRLAQESEKARETDLLKQSFLTNMSYEIRTPLNTVVGFAELFETEHDEADEPLFVDEIKRNSNSLLVLVNDILFLSRLDANMIEFNKVETDFSLLFDSYSQMGWINVNPGVKTLIENPYERLVVNIDAEHVGMAIQRLCANAGSYTERGSIRAKYEYRYGQIIISVEDTSKGIEPEMLPFVFERFRRSEYEKLNGSGLDLPIVKAVVEKMGGTVEVQSELGKGSTVWLSIPCEAEAIVKRNDINV